MNELNQLLDLFKKNPVEVATILVIVIAALFIFYKVFITPELTALKVNQMRIEDNQGIASRQGEERKGAIISSVNGRVDMLIETIRAENKIRQSEHSSLKEKLDEHIKKEEPLFDKLFDGFNEMKNQLMEFKITKESIIKDEFDTIMQEIRITTDTTSRTTYEEIIKALESNLIGEITRDTVLIRVAVEVNKRRELEYGKFTQLGFSDNIIAICREVDKDTFPKGALWLEDMLTIAKENIGSPNIVSLVDRERKQFNEKYPAEWERVFRNKMRIG